MKTITRYICEICGTAYLEQRLAEACEAFALDPCPVVVGQTVQVISRYDGLEPDIVVEVSLEPDTLAEMAENAEGPEAERLLPYYAAKASIVPHRWSLRTKGHHQLGKDWFGNEMCLDQIEMEATVPPPSDQGS